MRLRAKTIRSPDNPIALSAVSPADISPGRSVTSESEEERDANDSDTRMTDRSHGLYLNNKYFPAPYLFDEADYADESHLYGSAPWFDRDMLGNDLLINRYVTDGWLPGGVPVGVITSWCWRNQFACRDADLYISARVPREVARARFARQAMDGFNRLRTFTRIPVSDSSMFVYRTNGEQTYLERLNAIPAATIESWRGHDKVDNAAWCGSHPLLVAEFRYSDKKSNYWTDMVRHERRMRSKYDLAIPFQCMTPFSTRPGFRDNGFPRLTAFWRKIEVPRGCLAELPPVFTYKAEELMDANSGWWVVAYTEFVLRVVAFLLFEAYDNIRAWAVSKDLIRLARGLNLEPSLGSMENVNEALRLLTAVEATRFDTLPERWRMRGTYEAGSIGRAGAGADYVFFNVFLNRPVSENEAYRLRNRDRTVPDGHPRGWDFTAVPDGWVGDDDVPNPLAESGITGNWTGDVPTDDMMAIPGVQAGPSSARAAAPQVQRGIEGSGVAGDRQVRSDKSDLAVVREFLTEVGLSDEIVNGSSWSELRGYLRGRLNI